MKERTLSWIVRIVLLLIVAALAVFLYCYGKSHVIYIDNRDITIGDTTYKAIGWGEYSVDGGEAFETMPRMRDQVSVVRQRHAISFLWEDEDYNEQQTDVEFSLPVNEYEVIISLPAIAAGLGPEDYIQKFIPMAQQLGLTAASPAAEETAAPADEMMDPFGDMGMDF